MNTIIFTSNYNNCDVLIRVYNSQTEHPKEEEQIVGELLFKDKPHQRCTAWLPKGVANFISQELIKIKNETLRIHISNELPFQVGVLTSCKQNFDISIKEELKDCQVSYK